MVNLIFKYLFESSLCLILFIETYRILIANKTNFSWMRFYLLISMALTLIIPLIVIPIEWSVKLIQTDSFPNTFLMQAKQTATTVVNNDPNFIQANSGISILKMVLFIVFIVYMIGIIYKSYFVIKNLVEISSLIKKNSKVKEGNYWIVYLKTETPAFSFLNYIFINNTYKDLSSYELQVIKNHEMVHVKQYHTLDILFVELVGIVFWFNPTVNYLKKSIKEIHEYIVDERIAGHGENKKAYAQLLLTLASDTNVFDLATSFTGEHIKRRILMIAKPRTSPKYKLIFFVLVPLTAMLLLSFSYLKNPKANSKIRNEVKGLKLKKYCGVYFPSKRDINFELKPMEIILKDDKLFVNGTVALHFEADSIFSYTDNSERTIKFDLDSKKEVTGCALLKFETKGHANYIVLKGEYSKGKQVK
ncbi:M56 family metallopeptidase [Aurantibacillus circumpalustris]|uniref:M56 family metallopeptidase n=1 Tax=Aurantibacillus circumpalustris TaxID=3036359 RepID=UPI00295A8250|nr:M56 family metallopeptidase [Aurantibacillus circumpalustris]